MGGRPWVLVVERPRDGILAPARSFLARVTVIALVLIVGSVAGAWAVSRQGRRQLEVELTARRQADTRFRAVVEPAPGGRRPWRLTAQAPAPLPTTKPTPMPAPRATKPPAPATTPPPGPP